MVMTEKSMNMNRRVFFASLLLGRRKQATSFGVVVLEAFGSDQQTSAVLVHHAEPAARDPFARWLQSHPKSAVRIGQDNGKEVAATMFRVRMCFGRGLILLQEQIQIREREFLTVVSM
jgi:hypothetical protein